MCGGEEQRPVEPVRHDVLGEQRTLLVGVVGAIGCRADGHLHAARGAGHAVQGQQHRHGQSDDHRGDQVDRHGHRERHHQDRGVPAGGAQQRPQRPDLDHAHGRGEQHARKRRQRDAPDDPGRGRARSPRSTTAWVNASEGAGSSLGSAPIRATSNPATATTERRRAPRRPGRTARPAGDAAPRASMRPPRRASATAGQLGMVTKPATAAAAVAQTCSCCPPSTPSAAGSCCRAMTTAIPAVNPSITGIGSSRTSPPTRANASTTRIAPASSPTVRTPLRPEPVHHRDEDHGHRAGGAGHLQIAPAEHGGEDAGDDRGDEPAWAPSPELTPKASASGSATMATVRPATRSRRGWAWAARQSAWVGSSAHGPVRRVHRGLRRRGLHGFTVANHCNCVGW